MLRRRLEPPPEECDLGASGLPTTPPLKPGPRVPLITTVRPSLKGESLASTPARLSLSIASLVLLISVAFFLNLAEAVLEISEFMANNTQTLVDDDDDRSDWIEIHNLTSAAINLDGWFLTNDAEDLTRWPFPAVSLPANGYLLLFASEKDHRALGAPLHTNFQLKSGGGYLALVGPGGIVVSEFFPEYPQQRPDVTYGVGDASGPAMVGFLQQPTPLAPNGPAFPGIAGAAILSAPSCTFLKPFSVEIRLPDDASGSARIRFTTDGRSPTETSPVYALALSIKTTTRVRARVFEPGFAAGPIVSETYIALNSDLLKFSSNLPLVILDNFGAGGIPQDPYQFVIMMIFEPVNGRSYLTFSPEISTRAGIKVRGSSTSGWPKPSLTLEAWNELNEDKNIAPLGMPAESDWILWGPYGFDLALMRNPFIYELSNQVGRYATRSRFVEIFLNTDGSALSYADYFGVYAFMEKISRDEDRVDVEKLFPEHDREPGVSGGYIFKIDRLDPGDSGFGAAGQSLCYVYPKEIDIRRPERDAQERYVQRFFDQFYTALNASNFTDPHFGYAQYVDVDSWIDHHLLNVLPCNVDAFRLSGYMFKKRSGKLEMGPIWDFDRSMGSTDGRDANPRVWRGGGDGTDFFDYPWWRRMFTDPGFFQRYIDRWVELRKAQFSPLNINSIIDSMAEELREAQVRNLQRWGQTPRFGGYQGEVNHLKQWLADRVDFMDSQFVTPATFSSDGGQIIPGLALSMGAPVGTTYYTLDGTDPRLTSGTVSKRAMQYRNPVPITQTTEVKARVHNPYHVSLTGAGNPPLSSQWSGITRAFFSTYPPAKAGNLIVTELYYHPLDPTTEELQVNPTFADDDFEFIELKNIGAPILDLTGVRFTAGISFSFTGSKLTALAPGAVVLVARNLAAFTARYGFLNNLAGQYADTLDNAGDRIRLQDASGRVILDFQYQDDWYAVTDGLGSSLIILDQNAPAASWSEKSSWRPSTTKDGSPGYDDASGVLDSDGDGLPNDWESVHGLDPTIATGDDGPSGDPDGDAFSNLQEFVSGTHPRDPASFLRMSLTNGDAGAVILHLNAVAGKTYTILYSDSIPNGTWSRLTDIPAQSSSALVEIRDPGAGSVRTRLYRLVTPHLP